MENYSIYEDIAHRTGGDIYIGVVGPVRTGKSTFIKRFMQTLVLPFAEENIRAVMTDELPQSASGKTIMTTEPKFIPAKAVKIDVKAGAGASVRLVDCVGYSVAGAVGFEEDGGPRLVKTPWRESEMPFEEAAALGTEKVISEHSTIGVLITTDGSITDIPRENYVEAEEKTVRRLKEIGKPFVVLLNCRQPHAQNELCMTLQEKYGVPVLCVNVEEMGEQEMLSVLEKALFEFPVARIDVELPEWIQALPEENKTVEKLLSAIRKKSRDVIKMKDCECFENMFNELDDFYNPQGMEMDLGRGMVRFKVEAREHLFYRVLGEECGEIIQNERKLLTYVKEISEAKRNYDKVKEAFYNAAENGYGVVQPLGEELRLAKPELIKKSSGYGVKFKASAASYHILKVDMDGEVQSIIGTKQQSENYVGELSDKYALNEVDVWDTNIFGKSLKELMGDEISTKTKGIPSELQRKMRKTITKVVNDGKGNFLCIVF